MRLAWSVALVSCLGLAPLHAQFSGRVTGAVVDASGAAVPGAQVDLVLAGGKKPLMTVKTSADGLYHLIGIRPADFDIVVQAQGFVTVTVRNVTVDAARETQVAHVKLQLASVSQSVQVSAESQSVEISSAEVSGTISMEDIRNLPILGRDPLAVLQTQPGVANNGNSNTVINGLRTSYSDVTLDGVNIQDNYIRDNALDYVPNRLLLGQVRQMTLVSSNGNAASFGGATETAFSTPSGTNQFRGEAFWYNRNNDFSANDWFNNQSGIARPFLNQNQMGASVGGPILKDKLFFYSNYEAVRDHQQEPLTTVIPTATARQGIFQYRNAGGVLQQVNLLNLRGISIDPAIQSLLSQVPGPQFINTETPATALTYAGNVLSPDGLNTGGYRFNARDNEIRDNVTGKLDYNLSTSQALSLSILWNRDNSDRPDVENDYSAVPKTYNPTHASFAAASWRWTPTATLTNELRGGFNLASGDFLTTQQFGSYYLTDLAFSDPVNEFLPQGRNTNTFSLSDNAAWQHGRHYIQFGFHGQDVRVRTYDDSGVIPNYGLAMGSGEPALTTRNLPGISQTDLGNANNLLATLGGYVDTYSQTVNVTSRTSGFVPGQPFVRHLLLNDYAIYGQDKFKLGRTLTLTLGLRWEFPGTLNEENSLELQPILQGTAVQTLLSNASLDFAGSSVGRPYYHRQWKDFAPSFGFAWDVFGNGKTALRGGYSISYVNDQEILAPEDSLENNGGLQGYAYNIALTGRVSTNLPPIVLPTYQVPLTAADNFAVAQNATLALIDPNLSRPKVQQYSISIQHDFRGTIVEARYVGNHGVGEYRAFDYNQVQIVQNGFLADFRRAQSNGLLAQARGLGFNPNYNPTVVPGSQQLTVFPLLNNGVLSNPEYLNLIQTGEPGELATQLQVNGDNGKVNFFPNPNTLSADLFTNYSSSSYNSLQLVARHRMKNGFSLEANYTYSKVLSDGDGDLQSRYQAFLDINNPKLERSRANFDMNHVIKAFGEYELPFGKGHRFDYRPLNRIIGGWTVSGIMTWQSGAPFSILSERGTLNSEARSYYNTATTSLTTPQLDQVVKFQMTGNGPMMVNSSALNPADNSGVNADGSPQFAGQIFSNPTAGNLGTLQRRLFSGPWTFNIDMALLKTIPITERQSIEIRADAINALNHSTFWVGDQNINSTTFGVISSMFYPTRIMQFGAHYRF